MPRAFFHLHECGTVTEDEEGREIADLIAARRAAEAEARAIMVSEVQEGRLCLSCRIEVRDEHGAVLLEVPFKDALRVTGL